MLKQNTQQQKQQKTGQLTFFLVKCFALSDQDLNVKTCRYFYYYSANTETDVIQSE